MRSDGRGAAQLSKTRTNVQNSSTDGSRLWRLRLRIPVHVGPGATGLECAHALKLPSSNTDIAPARCCEASSRARCGDFIALHCVSPGHAAFGDQCSWATLRVGSEAACQSEAFRRQDTSAAKSWRTIGALRTRPPPSLMQFLSDPRLVRRPFHRRSAWTVRRGPFTDAYPVTVPRIMLSVQSGCRRDREA